MNVTRQLSDATRKPAGHTISSDEDERISFSANRELDEIRTSWGQPEVDPVRLSALRTNSHRCLRRRNPALSSRPQTTCQPYP